MYQLFNDRISNHIPYKYRYKNEITGAFVPDLGTSAVNLRSHTEQSYVHLRKIEHRLKMYVEKPCQLLTLLRSNWVFNDIL